MKALSQIIRQTFIAIIALMCIFQGAYAGVRVKSPARSKFVTAVSNATSEHPAAAHKQGFFSRIKSRVATFFSEPAEGERALFWGLIGIILWPLGVLAIYHGVNGLHSHSSHQQDMALIGIILGVLEVIATVAVIFAWIL
jgi:hypothetical protein